MIKLDKNDTQFEDAEQYTFSYNKDRISFKDIILQHLKDIGKYSSVEFRGGYWEKRTKIVSGQIIEDKTYVPDSREVYSNAVEYLYDMLYPHFDEDMIKAGEKADKEIEEIFNDNTVIKEPDREEKSPEEETKQYREFESISDRQSFRSERRIINRILFRALCCFLFRKKYLEMGTIED